MIKEKISNRYLAHFIYVPVAIIYSLIIGEDISVLIFITFMSFIMGGLGFTFNYFITIFVLNSLKSRSIWPFIAPILVALLLYFPINELLQYIDLGGSFAFMLFVGISATINISVYFTLRKIIGKINKF